MLYEVANYLTFPLTIMLCVFIIVSGYYYGKIIKAGIKPKVSVIVTTLGLFLLIATAFFIGVTAAHWN